MTIVSLFFSFYSYSHTSPERSGLLKVVFVDVGQGDAIYIEAPNGKQVLIDGGQSAKILNSLNSIMPMFDKSIDLVVYTHCDADHIGGLPHVIDNYEVAMVMSNGCTSDTQVYKKLNQKISEKNIKTSVAEKDMRIVLDEVGVYFDILFSAGASQSFKSNDGSIVGKLLYKDKSFMLTGDATVYTEDIILKNYDRDTLKSDVLKLGHHGSKTSSGSDWLSAVNPSYSVISAGLNNKYGHPNNEVLSRLGLLGLEYLETSKIGDIVFLTDGYSLSMN